MKLSPHSTGLQASRLAARSGMQKVIVNQQPQTAAGLVIGRVYEKWFNVETLMVRDPLEYAREYFERWQRPWVSANRHVTYFEGPNEPSIGSAEMMRRYAAFEAERVCLLAGAGAKAAVGGFSVGNPHVWLMPDFQPALDAAVRYGGIFHDHEYSDGTPPTAQFQKRSFMGRFQHWLDQDPDIFIAVTECGLDYVDSAKPWSEMGWTAEQYANHMWAYELELRRFPRVLAAFMFTYGDGWPKFQLENAPKFTDRLLALDASLPETVVTNQVVINAFRAGYGPLLYWPKILSVGWGDLALARKSRFTRYIGELALPGWERRALTRAAGF